MNAPYPVRMALAVARFHLRPVRRTAQRLRSRAARRTWNVTLGPVDVAGHRIVLRSPRLRDGPAWREARLRERERIEPWWASSPQSWAERHSDEAWVTGLLRARQEAAAGLAMPLVFEVDDQLAGECSLVWIAPHTATAELSVWLDSRWAAKGVSGVGAGLVVDHAVAVLGVHRLIAPIAVGNVAAAWGARRLGMRREGRMAGYLDVGGRRLDHHLWALTADQLPPGGLTAALRAAASGRPERSPGRRAQASAQPPPAPCAPLPSDAARR